MEQKAKQHKTEDALSATRAAIEEGIVPGGGVALLRTSLDLDELNSEGDEKTGVNILKRALEEPIRQIAQNAGIDGAVVVQKVKDYNPSTISEVPAEGRRAAAGLEPHSSKDERASGESGFGFNAETLNYEDLMKSGIVDPTKVVRSALQNAASAASMFLTTECVVAEKPEEKKKEVPEMPPGY